jgi:hypothetical protein
LSKTGAFLTRERGGRTHTLRVSTEYAVEHSAEGGERWVPTGLRIYRLANGQHVEALPDGTFRTVRTKVLLRRLDAATSRASARPSPSSRSLASE